jgi:hypothetical protein
MLDRDANFGCGYYYFLLFILSLSIQRHVLNDKNYYSFRWVPSCLTSSLNIHIVIAGEMGNMMISACKTLKMTRNPLRARLAPII